MTVAFVAVSLCSSGAVAQRQMENPGRGVVAVRQADGKVLVGWRVLGTDPDGIAFNLYTFMHDPQYRLSVAWQNVAYNQPPHAGFYVGEGMAKPPRPSIVLTPVLTTPRRSAR